MITTPNTIPPVTTDGTVLDRIPADETFDGSWPFAPHFYHGNGFEQHDVDEGEGDPIVQLHGEPMWGYLYRNVIPVLSKDTSSKRMRLRPWSRCFKCLSRRPDS